LLGLEDSKEQLEEKGRVEVALLFCAIQHPVCELSDEKTQIAAIKHQN
jgi:hypothetical protein